MCSLYTKRCTVNSETTNAFSVVPFYFYQPYGHLCKGLFIFIFDAVITIHHLMEHHLSSCFVRFFGFYFLVLCKYVCTSDDACIGKLRCQHLNGCESNGIFIQFVRSYRHTKKKKNWQMVNWSENEWHENRICDMVFESIFQSVRLFPAAINIFQNIGIIPSQFPHKSIFIFNGLTLLGRAFSTLTTDKSW